MAELTHEQEVEGVRKALALETAIAVEEANKAITQKLTFDRLPAYSDVFQDHPPVEPQRQIAPPAQQIKPQFPSPPRTTYKLGDHFNANPLWKRLIIGFAAGSVACFVLGFAIFFLDFIGGLCTLGLMASGVGLVVTYFQEKSRLNGQLANTPEYLQAVAAAEQQAAEQQRQADLQAATEQQQMDAQYEAEMKRYREELVPSYEQSVADHKHEYEEMRAKHEQEKAEWEKKRAGVIDELVKDIEANKEALERHYDEFKKISKTYREIWILQWLYDDMSSSDHDIRYATELLDRDRQRLVTQEAADRTENAITGLSKQVQRGFNGVMELQGVQIQSLAYLEEQSEQLVRTEGKSLNHLRLNSFDIAAREYRRRQAMSQKERLLAR